MKTLLHAFLLFLFASMAMAQSVPCDIWKAIKEADLQAVRECIDAKADLGAVDARGRTPLIAAVAADAGGAMVVPERQQKIVFYLLEGGADAKAADAKGYTAMHYAAYQGAFDLLELLFNGAGDVNQENLAGERSIHLAARGPLMDEQRVKTFTRLINYGADVNAEDHAGRTALHLICAHKARLESPESADGTISQIAQALVAAKAQLPDPDTAGNTPFSNAIREGYFQTATWLLEKGASARPRVLEDYSAIHIATEWGNLDMVDRLLKTGLDINQATGVKQQAAGQAYFFPKGSTPLDQALIAAHESKDPGMEKAWKGVATALKQRGGISRTFEEYVKGFKSVKGDSKPMPSKIR